MDRGILKEKKPLMPKNQKKYSYNEGIEVEEYADDPNRCISE